MNKGYTIFMTGVVMLLVLLGVILYSIFNSGWFFGGPDKPLRFFNGKLSIGMDVEEVRESELIHDLKLTSTDDTYNAHGVLPTGDSCYLSLIFSSGRLVSVVWTNPYDSFTISKVRAHYPGFIESSTAVSAPSGYIYKSDDVLEVIWADTVTGKVSFYMAAGDDAKVSFDRAVPAP